MKRIGLLIALACSAAFLAIGPAPRYIEELRIGGGFGSTPDGGVDIEADGDILTNGDVTVNGGDVFASGNLQLRANNGAGTVTTTGKAVVSGDADFNAHAAIGAGAGSPTATETLRVYEFPTQTSGAIRNIQSILNPNAAAASSTTYQNLYFETYPITAQSYTGAFYGVSSSVNTGPAGSSIGTAAGIQAGVNRNAGSGSITNAHGVLVTEFGSTGSIATQYGIKVNDMTGGASANYALHTGAGKVRLGDELTVAADAKVTGGDLDAGADTTTRGVLTLWDGSDGSSPGCIRIASRNGTIWYLFIEDDGTLKVYDALPTSNAQGTVVGMQN